MAGLACGIHLFTQRRHPTAAPDGNLASVLAQYGCRAHAKRMRLFGSELLLCNASCPLTRQGQGDLNHYVPLSPLDPAPSLRVSPRTCGVCRRTFGQASHLAEHAQMHGSPNAPVCTVRCNLHPGVKGDDFSRRA